MKMVSLSGCVDKFKCVYVIVIINDIIILICIWFGMFQYFGHSSFVIKRREYKEVMEFAGPQCSI